MTVAMAKLPEKPTKDHYSEVGLFPLMNGNKDAWSDNIKEQLVNPAVIALAEFFIEPLAELNKRKVEPNSLQGILQSQQPIQTLAQMDDLMKLDAKLRKMDGESAMEIDDAQSEMSH